MITNRLPSLVCVLAFLSVPTAPAADLVIINARVFTGTGAAVMERANIAVSGQRIETVSAGPLNTTGARVIDAAGKTVMPGLIDGHVHLFFDLQGGPGARFPTNDADARAYIQNRIPEKLRAHMEAGFTTLLSVIDFAPGIFDVKNRLNKGELKGPRLLVSGGVFVARGGHYVCRGQPEDARRWCDDHISVLLDSPENVREGVRRFARSGADVLVLDALTNAQTLPREAIQAMVAEADSQRLRILVHNSNASGVANLIAWGIDGFVHPPGVTRDVDGSLLASAGKQHIPVGITIGENAEPVRAGRASRQQFKDYEITRDNVLTLLRAGAVPVYGSDMPGAAPKDTLKIVTQALYDLGLSNADVLRAATRDAARVLLARDDLGTLEPGKLADIIIVDGDPVANLDALSNVKVVIKGGEVMVER